MVKSNSERIIKNTLSLYIRMILLTIISLYTVRVILQVLGAENYGLYGVVGGIVTMMSFFTGSLANASQRYFSIGIGRNDWKEVNRYFSVNFSIYLIFSIVVIFLGETAGLWFVLNKLTIPLGRMNACIIVYQLSIITFIVSILNAPFQALLVSDENISIYAYISIAEGIFKLINVYLLKIIPLDKLIVYSILQAVVSLIISSFYILYSLKKYKYLKINIKETSKNDFKEVFSYIGWNLIGALGSIGKGVGTNIVMNLFFNPAINAARSIAFSINHVVISFAQNFMKAVNPQITKKYAVNDNNLIELIFSSSKIAFSLLFIIILPLILNIDGVLSLWLGNSVPKYSTYFTILTLIDALCLTLTDSLATVIQATGKIKYYQMTAGILNLLNLPLAYVALRFIPNVYFPFIVAIAISVLMSFSRIIIYSKLNKDFKINKYFFAVIIPVIISVIVSLLVSKYAIIETSAKLINIATNSLIALLISIISIYFIALNNKEKRLAFSLIEKFFKIRNK